MVMGLAVLAGDSMLYSEGGKGRIMRKSSAVVIALMFLLALSAAAVSVDAHVPDTRPPPKFELKPIVVSDAGTEVEITIYDVANYHASRVNKKPQICVCLACAFRATQLGISKIWGEEIPARDDLIIISRLPTPGSRDCFQYVTGTGPNIETKTKGEFKIVLPDGTEVTDMSNKNLKKLSKDITLDNFKFTICRKSTGECFEVVVKEGVFPEDFFELRKKVKFGVPEEATSEEIALFKSKWADVRDKFLTLPDWELFEGVEAPFPVGGAMLFSALVVGLALLTGVLALTGRKEGATSSPL
ncbi:MAG: hypothetical protein DRJ31_04765 [Candidatus Methanomethylicota archaeon]|uniref:Formylmethanofuran dehydrogenase subunit E domain-containing protein n=1 Tax=Thermoproteota archaeon TaxID=2056631 RepID=A0A497EQI4_9CREN|nr:MAG: hypothetical protein DRJ31_04765 [Candidatus Verstraetearchaeota archaeon]